MKTETLFTREDASRLKIIVEIQMDYSNHVYKVYVQVCEPKKRKFIQVDIGDNYTYRSLPFGGKERESMYLNELLKYVTLEEIYKAKLNLWESLKPV